jgi:hypothetical protein
MLYVVALFRILAWLIHDAPPALDLVAVELIIATLLVLAAPKLSEQE